MNGERARALADFQRARAIEPDVRLEPGLGSPLRLSYDAAEPSLGPVRELPVPIEGWTFIEGIRTRTASLEREFFLRWVGADGEIRGNWFLAEEEPVPYPTRPAPVARLGRFRRNLVITGIVGAVLGAGAMSGAAALEARLKRSDRLSSAQVELVVANRVLGYGGIGLGVVGLGVVVVVSSLVVSP